jgi:hypothetical protein
VSDFLRRAGEILDIAASAGSDAPNTAIVIDRQGGMRMVDPAGWTLAALSAEFGASSVFKVERQGGAVRVEGLSGSERCLLQRASAAHGVLYAQPGVVQPGITRWRPNSSAMSAFLKPVTQRPLSPSAWYC